MQCANCRATDPPAYTLRAHVDDERSGDDGERTRTDGGDPSTVDLEFCSIGCLRAWT